MIGYKESDVGRMTKTIEMKVWRNCAQTTLMNKALRRTDQGDASFSDWLDRKGIREIQLGCWNPHQSASRLLTTTPPTMAGISSTRPSFMCQEPFQAQQVTRTDNRVHVGSAINSADTGGEGAWNQ